MPTSINYSFTQRFRVPASRAFKWLTDYDPVDLDLMEEDGKREVEKLTEDTFVLTDTYDRDQDTVTKIKLVRLRPSDMTWTSTHIEGPVKYSQFLYKVTPEGKKNCRVDFVGLQLEPNDVPKKDAAALARKYRTEDSAAWKKLARAMEKELL